MGYDVVNTVLSCLSSSGDSPDLVKETVKSDEWVVISEDGNDSKDHEPFYQVHIFDRLIYDQVDRLGYVSVDHAMVSDGQNPRMSGASQVTDDPDA